MSAANKPFKIVALSGSLRATSTNTGLVRAAQAFAAKHNATIELVDIDFPLFNQDKEAEHMKLPAVAAFRQKVKDADALLFASPEYNFGLSAVLKNALDFGSRPPANVFEGKAAAVISSAAGRKGAHSQVSIRQSAVYLNIHFINKPIFGVGAFEPGVFAPDGTLLDAPSLELLEKVVVALIEFGKKVNA